MRDSQILRFRMPIHTARQLSDLLDACECVASVALMAATGKTFRKKLERLSDLELERFLEAARHLANALHGLREARVEVEAEIQRGDR
jgi:hypothetical protein